MKLLTLTSVTVVLSALGVTAAPAVDNAQYYTLTTQTDYGCVYYASGTNTETATAPGVTSTIHDDSTKTVQVTDYIYPPAKVRLYP